VETYQPNPSFKRYENHEYTSVTIQGCIFDQLSPASGTRGGAFQMMSDDLVINESTFTRCSSVTGGAFYAEIETIRVSRTCAYASHGTEGGHFFSCLVQNDGVAMDLSGEESSGLACPYEQGTKDEGMILLASTYGVLKGFNVTSCTTHGDGGGGAFV
jgi:hypothetical protein